MNNSTLLQKNLEMKKSTLDSLLVIILAVGLPYLIVNIINSHKSQVFPYFSCAGLASIVIFIIFGKKLPFLLKVWTLILFGFVIGTIGLSREGLLSDGLLYFVFISILASMLINTASGVIIMILCIISTAIMAYATANQWFNHHIDIVEYFHDPGTWMSFIFSLAFFTSTAVYIYGRQEKNLVQYIRELTEKSEKLNASNVKLEKEREERRQAELQLTKSEIKFTHVFNSMEDGIVLIDNDHVLMDANHGFLRLTGRDMGSILGLPLGKFFMNSAKLKHFLDNAQSVHSIFNKNEFRLRSVPGKKVIPVELSVLRYQVEPEIGRIVIVKDITDKNEAENRIMNAIISSEEEERRRIAQDLHDGVGPFLSAMKMYLGSMYINDSDAKSLAIKKEMNELVNLSITSIREISGNLGSHVLRSLGLKAALADYFEKVHLDNPIEFESNLPDSYPFAENVEITLYRVMIELINNSLKYGQAGKIAVDFFETATQVTMLYKENGIGFNLQEVLAQQKGMGLYNIHSRIHSLGGRVEYDSSPGKGVNVNITLEKNLACRK